MAELNKKTKRKKEEKRSRPKTNMKSREKMNKSVINYGNVSKINEPSKKRKDVSFSVKRDNKVKEKSPTELVKQFKAERERSVNAGYIDKIVKENVKRIIKNKQREHVKERENEEKAKKEREELLEKNKKIREMNAKNTQSASKEAHKYAWGVDQKRLKSAKTKREGGTSIESFSSQRPPAHVASTNRDRISMLGLELIKKRGSNPPSKGKENVDKTNQPAKKKVCINLNIPDREAESETSKKAIRDYIFQKKERLLAEKKSKETEKEQQKEKISANKAKLEELVHNIFSGRKEQKESPEKKKIKKKKGKTKKHKKKRSPLIIRNVEPVKEGTLDNGAIMKVIKKELLEEIGLSAKREKEPIPIQTAPSSNEQLRERMAYLTKFYENLKRRSAIQSNEHSKMATKIQAWYRGCLARKKYLGLKQKKEAEIKQNIKIEVKPERKIEVKPETKIQKATELKPQKASQEVQTEPELIAKPAVETSLLHDSEGDLLGTEKIDLIDEEKLREKLIKEIQSVETQMQDIDIMEPQRDQLINYLSKSEISHSKDEGYNKPAPHAYDLPFKPQMEESFSEQNVDSSLAELIESEYTAQPRPAFERNSFHEFTLKRFKDLMKEENLSKIISMREKLLQYREKTEKRYLGKLFKSKKFSPKTYHRKKAELEKWITKEKVEIKKSKRQFIENWKRTADMIEETHKNAVRVKQMVFEGTLNGLNDTHSTVSLALNTSRDIIEGDKEETREKIKAQSERKTPKKSFIMSPTRTRYQKEASDDDLEALLNESGEGESEPLTVKRDEPQIILIKESEFPKDSEAKLEAVVLPEVSVTLNEDPPAKPYISPRKLDDPFPEKTKKSPEPAKTAVSPVKFYDPSMVEDVVIEIYEELVNSEMDQLFSFKPEKPSHAIEVQTKKDSIPLIEEVKQPNVATLLQQSLAFDERRGIDYSSEYISDFLELIFENVISQGKDQFLTQINTPLIIEPLDILHKLQADDSSPGSAQKPNASPIIPPEVEQRVTQAILFERRDPEFIRKCQETYNRAIHAAANEGLNLLRPYGLFGEPAPWSKQQRILFKEIVDTGLIVKNVKSMVQLQQKLIQILDSGLGRI
eukprot:TRINITY_DN2635_c0_g1_i1.p1 TRINITY_DN2635_c0_g1~~TRINITY_DN2635_c0_g1_i1.p1  ORF type:complete len:1097 (-),score=181.81 TRINITY_DN2635_c0_g1_i1:3258-6548(-)